MRVFVVDPHDMEVDNYISITEEMKLESFPAKYRTLYGISLGYFNVRPTDTEGTPLHRKYLKVTNGTEGAIVTNVTAHIAEANNAIVDLVSIPAEEEKDTDHCFVYLKSSNPVGAMRLLNIRDLHQDHALNSGICYQDNTVHHLAEGERRPIACCPAAIILNLNDTIQFTYHNEITNSFRLVTLKFDTEGLTVTENIVKPRREKTDRSERRSQKSSRDASFKTSNPRKMSAFGSDMAALLEAHPEFTLRPYNKTNKGRGRRRELERTHRRHDD